MLPDPTRMAVTHFWQIVLLIGLVWILCRTVGRRRAHLAHLLWLVVILKCLTPPIWSSHLGIFCWMQPAALKSDPTEIVTAPPSAIAPTIVPDRTHGAADSHDLGLDVTQSQDRSDSHWQDSDPDAAFNVAPTYRTPSLLSWRLFFFAWLSITTLVITRSFARVARCLRRAMGAQCRIEPELEALLNRLKTKLKVKRAVRLVVTRASIGPAVLGLVRPVILLPERILRGRTTQQLEPMLAHELLHIRRGDLWIGMLQVMAQAIWWFNPLVWYASRNISQEAERCCDEEAIASLNCSPARYAESLLSVLELKHSLQPVPAVPGVRAVDITSNRLERIMTLGHGSHKRSPWWCWVSMFAVSIVALPGALLAIAGDQPASEPAAAETEQNLVVTTASDVVDADEPVIVVNATVVTGPTKEIRSVVSNWDVLPARVAADRDSLTKSTFSPESGGAQHQIGPPAGSKAFGRSRTVIERDEPIEFVICDQDRRRIIMEKLQRRSRANLYSCPKITVNDGQPATIKDEHRRPFVVGIKGNEPQVRVVSAGLEMDVCPTIQNIEDAWLDCDIRLSHIRHVRSTKYNDLEVQLPEVARTRLRLGVHVPHDQTLILSGLSRDTEESGSESMLVLVDYQVIHPPKNSRKQKESGNVPFGVGVNSDAGLFGTVRQADAEPRQGAINLTLWELSLDECIQVSLNNSKVMRSIAQVRRVRETGPLIDGPQPIFLARVDEDLSLDQFRDSIRNHLASVERAYWELYFFYRNLEAAKTGRDDALLTWKRFKSIHESNASNDNGVEESQAREQYYFFRGRAEEAKRDLMGAERQLRYLMGIASSDGRIIQPSDEPSIARIKFEWEPLLAKAIKAEPEINRLIQEVGQLKGEIAEIRGYGPTGQDQAAEDARLRRKQQQLKRKQAKLEDLELEVSHTLTDAVQRLDSNYALTQTAFLQRTAAVQQVEVLKTKHEEGNVTLDFLLDAQRRAADATIAYYRSLIQYNMSIVEVSFCTRKLLRQHGLVV